MAFTARLGTANSYLSNILLGQADSGGGPPTYNENVQLDGISTVSLSGLLVIFAAKSIDCSAACSVSPQAGVYENLLTIAGSAAISSPGGVVYNIQRSIEGLSEISVLDGFSYQSTVDIDGISDAQVSYLYVMNHTLAIDGIADFSLEHLYTGNASLTVAGISALSLATNGVWYSSVGLFGTCKIYIENIYDVLLVSAVISGFTTTVTKTAPGSENPVAAGSFSATSQCIFNRPVTQTLAVSQSVVLKKPTSISAQTFSPNQLAVGRKVRVEAITHTLSFTQESYAARLVSQNLILTDDVEVTRIQNRQVSQTLTLTQSVDLNIVISRSLTQTLIFDPPNKQKLPLIGSQNQFEYQVPNLSVVLVPRQCLVILGVPTKSVLLPCPIFGDSQSYTGEINLKRAMTGSTYTYVKRTRTQKLKYAFELWTNKYLELRQFVIDHNSELITLQNHQAETWLVFLTNNPVEFQTESRWQPRGEKYNVTLEFEGIKIGG